LSRTWRAKLGLKPFQIIHHLMEMNIFTGSTQALEEEVAPQALSQARIYFRD